MENERKGGNGRVYNPQTPCEYIGIFGKGGRSATKFVKIPTVVSDGAKVIDAKDESIGTRPICSVPDLIGPNRSVRAET